MSERDGMATALNQTWYDDAWQQQLEVNEEREEERGKSGCLFCENPTPEKNTGWCDRLLPGHAAVGF